MSLFSGILAACILLLKVVNCDYVLEVRALSYRNTGGKKSSGFCCGAVFDTDCDSVPGGHPCHNGFVFCLRCIDAAEDENCATCPLAIERYATAGAVGDDDFSFATPLDSGVPNPMAFTGNIWPGGVQLYVEVHNFDTLFGGRVDDVYIPTEVQPMGSEFTAAQPFGGVFGNSEITLSFRVQCTNDTYGPNCTKYCISTDNENGHYLCSASGDKVCLSNWTNSTGNCLTPSASDPPNTSASDPPSKTTAVHVGLIAFAGTFVAVLAAAVLGVLLVCYLTKYRLRQPQHRVHSSTEVVHGEDVPLYESVGPRESFDLGGNTAYAYAPLN